MNYKSLWALVQESQILHGQLQTDLGVLSPGKSTWSRRAPSVKSPIHSSNCFSILTNNKRWTRVCGQASSHSGMDLNLLTGSSLKCASVKGPACNELIIDNCVLCSYKLFMIQIVLSASYWYSSYIPSPNQLHVHFLSGFVATSPREGQPQPEPGLGCVELHLYCLEIYFWPQTMKRLGMVAVSLRHTATEIVRQPVAYVQVVLPHAWDSDGTYTIVQSPNKGVQSTEKEKGFVEHFCAMSPQL